MRLLGSKYDKNAYAAGALPRPHWGSSQRSPDPLAGFGSASGRGWEGEGRKGEEKGKDRKGKKGRTEEGKEGTGRERIR